MTRFRLTLSAVVVSAVAGVLVALTGHAGAPADPAPAIRPAPAARVAPAARPNIVVLLTDDMRTATGTDGCLASGTVGLGGYTDANVHTRANAYLRPCYTITGTNAAPQMQFWVD